MANSSIKCEECDTSFTSKQGPEQHENMPLIEGKVVAGSNICGVCVYTTQQGRQENSYHIQDFIWVVL